MFKLIKKLYTLSKIINITKKDNLTYVKFNDDVVISTDGNMVLHSKDKDIVISSNHLHLNPPCKNSIDKIVDESLNRPLTNILLDKKGNKE